MKRILLLLPVLALAACGGDPAPITQAQQQQPAAAISITRAPATPSPSPTPPPQLCLVTRERGVPATYVPSDLEPLPLDQSVAAGIRLRREAAQALLQLLGAAREAGHHLLVISGYRSYEEQQRVLEQEIRAYGAERARRQVAPPGHSEHQLGVAADVAPRRNPYDLDQSFGGEPEGQWLAAHSARFGFLISYPAGKETITGYIYEPWHIRYVGVPLAQQILVSGQTLTEYLPAHGMDGCPVGG